MIEEEPAMQAKLAFTLSSSSSSLSFTSLPLENLQKVKA